MLTNKTHRIWTDQLSGTADTTVVILLSVYLLNIGSVLGVITNLIAEIIVYMS